MITYFEKQLEEIDYSLHSIDSVTFCKMVDTAVETISRGKDCGIWSGKECSYM